MGISLNKKCQRSSCVLLCKYSIYWVFTDEEIKHVSSWNEKLQEITACHSFCYRRKMHGICYEFPYFAEFQITSKLHKNHNLNHFAPTHILLRRLCPQPSDPNTIGKLRLSSFCIFENIGGLLWAVLELKLIQTLSLCVVVIIFTIENSPIKR